MSKIFNFISTICCIITIILLYSFMTISDSFNFNGYTILLFLLILLNPISNLCRLKKKIINNPIFHIMVILITSYISYALINSFIIYKNLTNENSMAHNMSTLYFSDRLIYIFIAILIVLLTTFLFKKNNIISNKDNSKFMLIIILITSLIPMLTRSDMSIICSAFNIALLIFTILAFIKLKSIVIASILRSYYSILIISSIVSINPIALILSIYLFIQLDTFGLNI